MSRAVRNPARRALALDEEEDQLLKSRRRGGAGGL
jgi:hypothetical protein